MYLKMALFVAFLLPLTIASAAVRNGQYVFIDRSEVVYIDQDSIIYGSSSYETVQLGFVNAEVDGNIDRIELPLNSTDYIYAVKGTQIQFYYLPAFGNSFPVLTFMGLNQQTVISFADGSTVLGLYGLGVAGIGTFQISNTIPLAVTVSLDSIFNTSDKSSVARAPENILAWSFQPNETVYLGCWNCNPIKPDSIHGFSGYGSDYSLDSIKNDFGTYGSKFSSSSACNEFAINPPELYTQQSLQFYGQLSINQFAIYGICNQSSGYYRENECTVLMGYCE